MKVKKYAKQGFLFCRVKTKIKGIVEKIPEINKKHVHVLNKLSNM
jgi:hypothetical protein